MRKGDALVSAGSYMNTDRQMINPLVMTLFLTNKV